MGAYLFGPLASATSFPCVMAVCAVLATLGALLSHMCIGAEDLVVANPEDSSSSDLSSPSDYVRSLIHSQGSCDSATADSSSSEMLEAGPSGMR